MHQPLVTQGKKYYFRAWASSTPTRCRCRHQGLHETLGQGRRAHGHDQRLRRGPFQLLYPRFQEARRRNCFYPSGHSTGDQDFTAQLTELIAKSRRCLHARVLRRRRHHQSRPHELEVKFRLCGADAADNPDTSSWVARLPKASCTPPSPTIRPYLT